MPSTPLFIESEKHKEADEFPKRLKACADLGANENAGVEKSERIAGFSDVARILVHGGHGRVAHGFRSTW